MSIASHLAHQLWGMSLDMLNIMFGLSEMVEKKTPRKDFKKDLEKLLGILAEWHLDSEKEFVRHFSVTRACHDILVKRDGYEAWHKEGQSSEDLRREIFPEYKNLQKVLAQDSQADLQRAQKFVMLLNDWSMGVVTTEQRERFAALHPGAKFITA